MGQTWYDPFNRHRQATPTEPAPVAAPVDPYDVPIDTPFFNFMPDDVAAQIAPTKGEVLMARFPSASSLPHAELWVFLTDNPNGFYNATVDAYNQEPTAEGKAHYKAYIHDAILEYESDFPGAALGSLGSLPINKILNWVIIFAPEWIHWGWITWAQRDLNGFLSAHLGNISKGTPEAVAAAGLQLKELMDANMPDGWLETASIKNQEKYLQIAEPELYAAIIAEQGAQAAAFQRQAVFGKIMGFGVLGVLALGIFGMMGKK